MSARCPGSGKPLETSLDGNRIISWCSVCRHVTLAADDSLPDSELHGAAAMEHDAPYDDDGRPTWGTYSQKWLAGVTKLRQMGVLD